MDLTNMPTEEELAYTLEKAFQIFARKQDDWDMPHDSGKSTGDTVERADVSD